MFAILKSIDLYGFQNDAMRKRQWADLWSEAPLPFFPRVMQFFKKFPPPPAGAHEKDSTSPTRILGNSV
jgi:hypothetical protein